MRKNPRPVEDSKAKAYAYKRLAAQNLHSEQLRKILKEREVSEKVIEEVITECTQLGYINDHAWVESQIRIEMSKRRGPRSIIHKLVEKGIARSDVEEMLMEMDNRESQIERVKELVERKYASRDLSDFKEREKVVAAIVRRGYSIDVVYEGISIVSTG